MDERTGIKLKPSKPPRGFAALTVERRKEIARMGGIAAHAGGSAHQFSTEEAIAAGKKRGKLAKQNEISDLKNQETANSADCHKHILASDRLLNQDRL